MAIQSRKYNDDGQTQEGFFWIICDDCTKRIRDEGKMVHDRKQDKIIHLCRNCIVNRRMRMVTVIDGNTGVVTIKREKRKGLPDEVLNEVRALHAKGMSFYAIGKKMKLYYATVKNACGGKTNHDVVHARVSRLIKKQQKTKGGK